MSITSDPIQDRMGLWSRKCHRFLIAGPFNFYRLTSQAPADTSTIVAPMASAARSSCWSADTNGVGPGPLLIASDI